MNRPVPRTHTRVHMNLRRLLWPVGALLVWEPCASLGRLLQFWAAMNRQRDQAMNVDQWITEHEWL